MRLHVSFCHGTSWNNRGLTRTYSSGTAVNPAFGGSSLGLDGAVQAVGINGALITDLMAAAQSSSKITR